jgi:uncharacterized protein YqhQ
MTDPIIGGQAVIEGVMMQNQNKIAIAVRRPDRKISVKKEEFNSIKNKFKFLKLPILRGAVSLFEMMIFGIKALTYSANEAMAENEDEKLSTKEIVLTMLFSIGMAIGLFFLLPLFITKKIASNPGILFNLIDGLIRIAFVLTYIIGISFLKDVKRLFEYHGAEHKVVNCHEAKKELTLKNVKKFTTLNPRCGTSFIFYVLIISVLVFSLVNTTNIFLLVASRILLIPVIAGLSYEILRFSAKHKDNICFKILIYPGFLLQKITTREPNDKQIEVAIKSMKAVL